MVKNAKDLRGKSLPDLFEKMLTTARYFIVQKNNGVEFSERTMYDLWNTCFPSDFRITKNRPLELVEGKYYSQLVLNKNSANIDKGLIKNYSNKWQKIYCWVVKYIKSHTLEECDAEINKVRKEQCKELIRVFKPLRYYVRDNNTDVENFEINTYSVFDKNSKGSKTSSYSVLMEYANKLNIEKLNTEQ